MANLFELVGSVAIDITDAETKLDKLISKADSLGAKLGGGTSVGVGGGGGSTTTQSTTTSGTKTTTTAGGSGSNTDTSGVPVTIGSKGTGWGSVMVGNLATKGASIVGNALKKAYQTGINFNANLETYTATFETLLKTDTEQAAAYVNRLVQFAKDTPLSLQGVVKSANELIQSGIGSEEVFDVMQTLGDLALGDSDKFYRASHAYSQIMSYGTLKAEESNQLIEASVPIRLMLQEELGVTGSELTDMQRKGDVPAELVATVFKKAVSGELNVVDYEGGMDKAMKTYKGQKEKRDDAAEQVAGLMTEKFFEQNKGFMAWTTSFLEGIIDKNDEWKKLEAVNNQRSADKASQQALSPGNAGVIEGLAGKYAGWTDAQKNAATLYATNYANNYRVDWAKEQLALEVTDEEMQSVMADIHTLFRTYENPLEITQLMFTDEAAAELQERVKALKLDATVSLYPAFMGSTIGYHVGLGTGYYYGGSHANGLDRVPFDNYQANLHKGEAVLTAREAEMWRSGGYRTDTSRLEAIMNQVLAGIQTIAGNTGAGQNIILDSGVLVGQLAPGMNSQLGTLSKRRGRT